MGNTVKNIEWPICCCDNNRTAHELILQRNDDAKTKL